MSTKIGNADEIRMFARQLVQYCQETRGSLEQLRGHLEEMRSSMTWADDNHAAYSSEFEEAARSLYQTLSEFESAQANSLISLASQYDDVRY